jgi:outer membrane protein OmpA-like peptidoglycan-associated protein
VFFSFCIATSSAWADGRGFVGVDVGAMIPTDEMEDFVNVGMSAAPFAGYMFNDYIGLMGQLHVLAGKSKETNFRFGGFPNDDNTTWWAGASAGPKLAIPLGEGYEIYGTFHPGIFTGLTDEAITDTSFGFTTGGGLNIPITPNFLIGVFARYNRLYQRVHTKGDAKYVTTGIALTYMFGEEEVAPPPPTPAPAAPRAAATPPVKRKLVPRAVYFDFDKSNIRADARATLDEAINIIKTEGYTAVIAEGHTDSVGTDQYNQALSMRRARSVRDYLIKGGVPAANIQVEGFGESKPVASNDTADGRQQNRRVELRVQ